jgi:hypothetical protein
MTGKLHTVTVQQPGKRITCPVRSPFRADPFLSLLADHSIVAYRAVRRSMSTIKTTGTVKECTNSFTGPVRLYQLPDVRIHASQQIHHPSVFFSELE